MNSELLRSVLAGVPMPLLLINPDERVQAANDPAEKLFGAGSEGRHYNIVLRHPDLSGCVEAALWRGRAGQTRYVRVTASGEVTYRVMCSPVGGDAGLGGGLGVASSGGGLGSFGQGSGGLNDPLRIGRGGALVSFEDITDLEQAGQIRRDFVANVSHELRTPLTALLGFIETLRGAAREDAAARERFLGIMAREAERMNRLVSDLLSLSRVEAEERVRPSERVDVVGLVHSSVAALRPFARDQGVELEVTGEGGPVHIPADADQLVQVFHNLIENAVKYGAPGKLVTVAIGREAREPGLRGPAVRIDVIDRGEGIAEQHLPRLTERFYRVDSHRSREQGGTGLGLAIVKHIVNRHRGRLRINSERGKGSQFSIVLPEI